MTIFQGDLTTSLLTGGLEKMIFHVASGALIPPQLL